MTTLKTADVWQGKHFTVRQEITKQVDGTISTFEHVWRKDGTRTIVQNDSGKILITREFRYELDGYDWRLPGGKLDAPDENIIEAGKRELREETGVSAKRWKYLWASTPDGTVRFQRHFLFASDITIGNQNLDQGEDIHPHWFSPSEVIRMALDGEIREEISALSLLRFLAV